MISAVQRSLCTTDSEAAVRYNIMAVGVEVVTSLQRKGSGEREGGLGTRRPYEKHIASVAYYTSEVLPFKISRTP